ncbi:MAG: hypothetical protein WCT25_00040 [Candidatus Paceibacterota bacterium]|jgi:hypothetical protein
MEFLVAIKDFLSSHDFQVSFWSEVIVAAVVGFVVYQYTDVFKSPNLCFVVKQDGFYRDTILLVENGDDYTARFQFAIRNSGNKALKAGEGYWHLYVNTNLPTIFSVPEEHDHNRDLIRGTIYPGSFLDIDLVYELKVKKEDIGEKEIPYFFSTDHGQYPAMAEIDPATGKVLFKNMGYIKFELP